MAMARNKDKRYKAIQIYDKDIIDKLEVVMKSKGIKTACGYISKKIIEDFYSLK